MIRRRYQEGWLLKKGNVYVYRYREDILDAAGNIALRRQPSVSFGKVSKQQAIDMRDAFLRRHGIGRSRPKASMTLAEFWSLYFVPRVVEKKSHYTQKLYAELFRNHIEPTFGRTQLGDISRDEVDGLLSEKLHEGYATQTVHHIHEALSKALGTAHKYRWLEENAASGVELPPIETVRPARALNLEEVGLIANALPEPGRTAFMVGVIFGLRIGEILGLQVEDVDLAAGILWVRRSATRGVLNRVKGRDGHGRRFAIPPLAQDNLERHLAKRRSDSPWLFATRRGGFHNDRTFWHRFVWPHVQELPIPRWSWHSLRHTFLTYNGNDADIAFPVLQSLAGHTNPQTTMKYIDPFAHEKARALAAWGERLGACSSLPVAPTCSPFAENGRVPKSEVGC